MKSIRRLRNIFALLFMFVILLTVWFAVGWVCDAVVVFFIFSVVILVFLIRQSRLLYDVKLIRDNCILFVSSVIITSSRSTDIKEAEETIVSTFGIIIGNKIFKWGCDGVSGVRLNAIRIDRTRIYLTFGNRAESICVELLHGMDNEQMVQDVKQKLLYETGVQAIVTGW